MKLKNVLAFKASSSIDYQRTVLLVVGLDFYVAQVFYVPLSSLNKV